MTLALPISFSVAVADAPAPLLKEKPVPGKKFFIRNYPDQPPGGIASPVVAPAMHDGVFGYETEIMKLRVYGTPKKVAVVATSGVWTKCSETASRHKI